MLILNFTDLYTEVNLKRKFFILGHSNVFIYFVSFENPKTYQAAREKNKEEKITKSMQIF
jgi:hypothetical protein